MSIPLSAELQSAVDAHPGEPVPVIDERTNAAFQFPLALGEVVHDGDTPAGS